jgi:hypothetical protein
MIVQIFKFGDERERERAMAKARRAASAYASMTGVRHSSRFNGNDAFIVERWLSDFD